MKLIWAPKAKMARIAVVRYLVEEFGHKTAAKFDGVLKDVVAQIKNFPKSGEEERFLTKKDEEYRSIPIGQHNKLVYRVLEAEVHIDDIWDTRREPKKQADETTDN